MSLLTILLYIVFVLAAIVLVVVVLLQEGKGGGLGEALGGHAQSTFGVGAKGINQFTGYTAAVFLISAILIHVMNRQETGGSLLDDDAPPTLIEGTTDGAGAGSSEEE